MKKLITAIIACFVLCACGNDNSASAPVRLFDSDTAEYVWEHNIEDCVKESCGKITGFAEFDDHVYFNCANGMVEFDIHKNPDGTYEFLSGEYYLSHPGLDAGAACKRKYGIEF